MPRRRTTGLTLLELAIVLAVLAVLGALALPSMGSRMAHQRLQATAQTLADDITEARFQAASRGQPLHVQAHAGADWCWAVSLQPDCSCGGAQACQLHRVRSIDYLQVKMLEGRAVQLDPAGTAERSVVALLESPRGARLQVEVSALGRARVCANAGNWPALAPC